MKKKIFLGLFLSSLAYGSTSYPLFEKNHIKMEIVNTYDTIENKKKGVHIVHEENVNLKIKEIQNGKNTQIINIENELHKEGYFVTFITYETER